MKIKFIRSYKKLDKNGNPVTVFVYGVTGTPAQLAEYKKIQGDNYRETEEGVALHFSTRFAGNSGNLIITQSGKAVVDMSAFDQAASLASQYGGNLGQELAKAAAASLIGGPVTAPIAVTAPADLNKA